MVRGHQIVPAYGKRVTDVLKGMLRPSLMAAPVPHGRGHLQGQRLGDVRRRRG